MENKDQKNYQDISIGVKVSEDLIKNTVALQVAKQLEGTTEAVMTKMIIGILNFKKDGYNSSPTMIEEICKNNIRPLIEVEAEKYFREMAPEISRLIQKTLKANITKEKVLKNIETGLARFTAENIKISIY